MCGRTCPVCGSALSWWMTRLQMAFTVTHYRDCARCCVQNVALFCDTPINTGSFKKIWTIKARSHEESFKSFWKTLYNYTYALQKSAASAVPVFSELTTAERLHVQTPCTLCRIFPKSDTKCGQDEQKFIYNPKHRVDFTALTFTTRRHSKIIRQDFLCRISPQSAKKCEYYTPRWITTGAEPIFARTLRLQDKIL